MHVEHRRVVEGDADGLELGGQGARESFGKAGVAAAPERGHRRPLGEGRLQPRDAPALLIYRDPERDIGNESRRLERHFGHLLGFHDISREQNHAAQAEVACDRTQLAGNLMAIEPGDQQLTNLASKRGWRHGAQIVPRAAPGPNGTAMHTAIIAP